MHRRAASVRLSREHAFARAGGRLPGVPDEDGLGHEVDPEALAHAAGDLAREGDELGRRAAAAVRQRERVLGGDRDAVGIALAAAEAGALDEPGGGGLHASVGLGERRRGGLVAERVDHAALEGGEVRRVEDRVREERPRADRVRVGRVDDHALAAAQREDGVADVLQRRRRAELDVERPGELGVADRGRAVRAREDEGDREDDPAAGRALEDAGAVGEAAGGGVERLDRVALTVEHADGPDRLGDVLAVGADVLDRGRADRARDARQALDPGEAAGDTPRDQRVPGPAGPDLERDAAVRQIGCRDPAHGDADDRAGEALVGDDDVAAAREQEQRRAGAVRAADLGDERLLVAGRDEPPGGAAEAQGREVGESGGRHGDRGYDALRRSPRATPGARREPQAVLDRLARGRRAPPRTPRQGPRRPRRTSSQMRRPSLPPRLRRPPRGSHTRRPAPPRPPVRALVAFAGVLTVLVGAWAWLRDSPLVAVRTVTVPGVSGPAARQVRDALVDAARDMTTLHVRHGDLRTAVDAYPGVLKVETDADFPHGLRIAVRERNPVATVVSGSRRVPVAADGTLMPTSPSAGLPEISAQALPGGAHASAPDVRRAIAVLAAAPPALRARVRRVYMSAHGITAPLRDGPTLYLGGWERLRAKWIAAATVLADRSSAGATYLDLRLPERPAAGGLEPPPVASQNGAAALPGTETTTPAPTSP